MQSNTGKSLADIIEVRIQQENDSLVDDELQKRDSSIIVVPLSTEVYRCSNQKPNGVEQGCKRNQRAS